MLYQDPVKFLDQQFASHNSSLSISQQQEASDSNYQLIDETSDSSNDDDDFYQALVERRSYQDNGLSG